MLSPQSAALIEAVNETLRPEFGFSAKGRDLARTLITRGTSWLEDDAQLCMASIQCAYAARMGVGSSGISDGAIASQLLEKSLVGLETLAGRDPEQAKTAYEAIGTELSILLGKSDAFPHVNERLRKLSNNDLSEFPKRLEALKPIESSVE